MRELLEEDQFIIKNLELVNEIINSKENLQSKLNSILFSLAEKLTKEDWWSVGWELRYKDSELYITHPNWQITDGDGIWIGASPFLVDSLFGQAERVALYIWVHYPQQDLSHEQKETFRKNFEKLLAGNLLHSDTICSSKPSTHGFFLVHRRLNANFLLENQDVNRFLEQATAETHAFIAHYCRVLQEQKAHKKTLVEFLACTLG